MGAELLVSFWNRKPGLMASCRIWLERAGGTHPYRIRWRGPGHDRDGQATVRTLDDAAVVVRHLIETSGWPYDQWQATPN